MPITEQPKELEAEESKAEALTQVEAEKIDVPDYVGEKYIPHYIKFRESYGKEVADYFFQEKVEINKLAELYSIKLRNAYKYSFPELEKSLDARFDHARLIDTEGGIYISHSIDNERVSGYRLNPLIVITNTSKELAESAASLTNTPLPNPQIRKQPNRKPCYYIERGSTPAILLTCLARPLLIKRENIEVADKIIELFKERATLPCNENREITPRSEPRHITAYKLLQAGMRPKEIAQKMGCKPRSVYSYLYLAKNYERVRKQQREYNMRYREEKKKSTTKLLKAS